MDVFLQELPFLHPLAVHFPVAFISGALLGLIVWAVTGGRLWRLFILSMLALAFLGGAVAYATGRSMPIDAAAADLSAIHVSSASTGFVLTGIALIVVLVINFYLERRTTLRRHPPDPPLARVIIGLLVFAAWTATAVAAYSGHLLVQT